MLSRGSQFVARIGSFTVRGFCTTTENLVVLQYDELKSGGPELLKKIESAYSYDGPGILAVQGVPGYSDARRNLLPLAKKFADLPEDVKAKYEHAESFFSFGWSHGKEQLEGRPDFGKGSYYANPQYDRPFEDEEIVKKYPAFAHPNIWPTEMPELQVAFKALGQLIVDTGLLLSKQCDALVKKNLPTYEDDKLYHIIRDSRVCKARLLYYFPATEEEAAAAAVPEGGKVTEESLSSWCGWHNDHGSLTGLANAMYLNEDGEEVACPDSTAGLYARTRRGDVVRVVMPKDCMAFQIGETAQVHSGGVLQATPHAVKAASLPGIGRGTFAVFMEPEWDEPMTVPDNADQEVVLRGARGELLPPGVRALSDRWENGITFGKFTDNTLNAYY